MNNNSNLKQKIIEYKRKTGYDKMSLEERMAVAHRLNCALEGFKDYEHSVVMQSFKATRKGREDGE